MMKHVGLALKAGAKVDLVITIVNAEPPTPKAGERWKVWQPPWPAYDLVTVTISWAVDGASTDC